MTPKLITAAALGGLLATAAESARAAAPLPVPSCQLPPPLPGGRPDAARLVGPVCIMPLDLLEAADEGHDKPRAEPSPEL